MYFSFLLFLIYASFFLFILILYFPPCLQEPKVSCHAHLKYSAYSWDHSPFFFRFHLSFLYIYISCVLPQNPKCSRLPFIHSMLFPLLASFHVRCRWISLVCADKSWQTADETIDGHLSILFLLRTLYGSVGFLSSWLVFFGVFVESFYHTAPSRVCLPGYVT